MGRIDRFTTLAEAIDSFQGKSSGEEGTETPPTRPEMP
jgi:hypothetical protein